MKRITKVIQEFNELKKAGKLSGTYLKLLNLRDKDDLVENFCPHHFLPEVREIAIDFGIKEGYLKAGDKEDEQLLQAHIQEIMCPMVSPTGTNCLNCWKAEINHSYEKAFN